MSGQGFVQLNLLIYLELNFLFQLTSSIKENPRLRAAAEELKKTGVKVGDAVSEALKTMEESEIMRAVTTNSRLVCGIHLEEFCRFPKPLQQSHRRLRSPRSPYGRPPLTSPFLILSSMLWTTVVARSTPGSKRRRQDGYAGRNVLRKLGRTVVLAQLVVASQPIPSTSLVIPTSIRYSSWLL